MINDIIKPRANHTRVPSPADGSNPTAAADALNASLAEKLQYPQETYTPLFYDDERDFGDDFFDLPPEKGDMLVRVARTKTLQQAQEFYDRKRKEQSWASEAPIFRTARFWCKQVWTRKTGI